MHGDVGDVVLREELGQNFVHYGTWVVSVGFLLGWVDFWERVTDRRCGGRAFWLLAMLMQPV